MLLSGDRRGRVRVSASVLAAMVLALLVALCPPSSAEPPADALVVAQSHAPGCGKGASEDDRGAHPSAPPRGGLSYEPPPPAPYDAQPAASPLCGASGAPVVPERGPPPIEPPTPVSLSVLRV